MHPELFEIHRITENIFLSGVFPMENDSQIINKLGIKYILSCLDKKNVEDIHNKIIINNPDITILYLPLEDDIQQNLWKANNNKINIMKYCKSANEYTRLTNQLKNYQRKPMIEIGYHFIDEAIESNKRILVHCRGGISRSVSMIIYYLMKKYRINFSEAHKIVNNIRKLANPNNSFQKQLIMYQRLKDKCSEHHAEQIIRSISDG